MSYSNSTILAAVLNKWMQPLFQQVAGNKVSNLPLFAGIENKIRSTGWVSPNWSLMAELSPIMGAITGTVMEPIIASYLANIPDEAIPGMAHALVDQAIENGGLSLFEGKVKFEKSDMEELKKYLNYNLPTVNDNHYEVKIMPDK